MMILWLNPGGERFVLMWLAITFVPLVGHHWNSGGHRMDDCELIPTEPFERWLAYTDCSLTAGVYN